MINVQARIAAILRYRQLSLRNVFEKSLQSIIPQKLFVEKMFLEKVFESF